MIDLWDRMWQEAHDQAKVRSPEFEDDDYYRSGRASKAWPDKEGPEWWHENGPKFVKSWVQWRDGCGLKFAETPDIETGELRPMIEIEAWAYGPDDLCVKSITDRVMTDGTDYYIVDLKTGRYTDPWPLQLALNRLCLQQTFDIDCRWGGFWKARSGGIVGGPLSGGWFDLSVFTEDWLWDQVWKAREIRDRGLFMANPNNLCKSACGVSRYCLPMGGDPSPLFQLGATVTQNNQEGASDVTD